MEVQKEQLMPTLLDILEGLHMILSQVHHGTQTPNEGIKFVVCM